MNNTSFGAVKLRVHLQNLVKTPTKENAAQLLQNMQDMKSENFQFIQDSFIANLLMLVDGADGLNKNEKKAILIECINFILHRSRVNKKIFYQTTLMIVLRQIFDFTTNSCIQNQSEELKIASMECFEVASTQLDSEVVELFMVSESRVLLAQCITASLQMISNEKYTKLRVCATKALMALLQLHDKSDESDIVLRNQIANNVFIMLPKITVVLLKTCQEDTIKTSSLVLETTKALGRLLCLILEDYEKDVKQIVTTEDFIKLLQPSGDEKIIELKSPTIEQLKTTTRTKEWIFGAARKLKAPLEMLKVLRGCQHYRIRLELASLSWNLLNKCLPNIQSLVPLMLENLVLFADDADKKVRDFSCSCLAKLPDASEEIVELFSSHLVVMPRIIVTGDESEQTAGMTLLNSFLSGTHSQLNASLQNPIMLERLINLLLCCCELQISDELLFHESLPTLSLDDQFYRMESPWKQFKHLKSPAITKKFSEVCFHLGRSSLARIYTSYLMDNMNSTEYLVLLMEIMKSGNVPSEQIESIVEEFLNETYWTLSIQPIKPTSKPQMNHQEWFKDTTPGLYESAIEVRMQDVDLNANDDELRMNLKQIKYNILSTCLVLELMGCSAEFLKEKFRPFLLRSLHLILEKAGNTNFIIRSAGLFALNAITVAMGKTEISQLIDEHSDFLLINIKKLLKSNHENEAILDMTSVVFKYSQNSMTAYIKDIVATCADQITVKTFAKNTRAYLKIFQLYVSSVNQSMDKTEVEATQLKSDEWSDFLERALFELDKQVEEDVKEPESVEPVNEVDLPTSAYDVQDEQPPAKLPEHIELVQKIGAASVQYFSSNDQAEVIIVHQIFMEALPVLLHYENTMLPLVSSIWYPFTKQFQGKDLVILQNSFRLLCLIGELAKEFVNRRTLNDAFPVLNKFLMSTFKTNMPSYSQQFKLQHEVLAHYGQLLVNLDVNEKVLNDVVDILLKFYQHSNEGLAKACLRSFDVLRNHDPCLVDLKLKFHHQ